MSGNNPYSKDGESALDFLDNINQRQFERYEQRREDRREQRVEEATAKFRGTDKSAQEAPHGVDKATWEQATVGAQDSVETWLDEKQEWRRQFREAYYDTLEAGLVEDDDGGEASRESPEKEDDEYEPTELYYAHRTPNSEKEREYIKTVPLTRKK